MKTNASMMHDPGGKVRIRLPEGIVGEAVFGGVASEYRYRLSRVWGAGPRILFVMMNPSTADPTCDDPSVAKCRRMAVRWGFGSMYVGNTFAYRATDQNMLATIDDPIGPDNDKHLCAMAAESARVIFAYGKPKTKSLKARGSAVAQMLREQLGVEPYVLRLTLDGTPSHPLYLPESTQPVLWRF